MSSTWPAIDDGDEDLQRHKTPQGAQASWVRHAGDRCPGRSLNAAEEWDTVLLDSLTCGEEGEPALPEFDRFLTRAEVSTCLS